LATDEQCIGQTLPNRRSHGTGQTGFGIDTDPQQVQGKIDIGESHLLTVRFADLPHRILGMTAFERRAIGEPRDQHHEIGHPLPAATARRRQLP
jgi:hypothetical protein